MRTWAITMPVWHRKFWCLYPFQFCVFESWRNSLVYVFLRMHISAFFLSRDLRFDIYSTLIIVMMSRSSSGSMETPSRIPWVALIHGAKISQTPNFLYFKFRQKWREPESANPISSWSVISFDRFQFKVLFINFNYKSSRSSHCKFGGLNSVWM